MTFEVRAVLVFAAALFGALLPATAPLAQSQSPGGMPPPSTMSLAQSAAMRFPQPVHVRDLLHRAVLQPVESQTVLGRVEQIVRIPDGTVAAIVMFGGFLGFGARPIAVPIDAMVLLGDAMEVVAFTPEQLGRFATFRGDGAAPLSGDTVLKVGLAKPSH